MKIEGYEVVQKIDKRRTTIGSVIRDNVIYISTPFELDNTYLKNLIKENLDRIIEASKPRELPKDVVCYYNEIKDGGTFYINEKPYTISFVKSKQNRYEIKNNYIIIYASSEAKIKPIIILMMEDILTPIIKRSISKYEKIMDKKVNTFSFHERKRAYAVCMPKSRNIECGYKIISLREELIDYIIAHEMTHLEHANHSRAFYDRLKGLVPKSDELKKEIKHLLIQFVE